jgi:YbbR domain-containing protein
MSFRSIVLDNWGIKLVSLVLSLTLWFYVTSKGKAEMTLMAPLELRNIPQGMTIVGDVTGYVDVRVQGQERLLRDITVGKKVSGVIDLSLTREGENSVRISPDDIKRPAGVAVTYMSPSVIKVKLERLKRKVFRLKPLLHGAPSPGYRIAGIKVIPPKITIEGPASAMEAFNELQTMPIDIQGAKDDMTVEPKIDYRGQPVKLLEKNIAVRISVERIKR